MTSSHPMETEGIAQTRRVSSALSHLLTTSPPLFCTSWPLPLTIPARLWTELPPAERMAAPVRTTGPEKVRLLPPLAPPRVVVVLGMITGVARLIATLEAKLGRRCRCIRDLSGAAWFRAHGRTRALGWGYFCQPMVSGVATKKRPAP